MFHLQAIFHIAHRIPVTTLGTRCEKISSQYSVSGNGEIHHHIDNMKWHHVLQKIQSQHRHKRKLVQ